MRVMMGHCAAVFFAAGLMNGLVLAAPDQADTPIFVHARLDPTGLVVEALSTQPLAYRAASKDLPSPARLSFDARSFSPAFQTQRGQCRVDTIEARCHAEENRFLANCSSFEGLESRFIRVSTFRSSYGDTPAQRGAPSAWDQMSTKDKALSAPLAAVATIAAAVYVPWMAAGSVIRAIADPGCVGVKTRWVEFDHDSFGAAARRAWGLTNLPTRVDAAASALSQMAARSAEVEQATGARWSTKIDSYSRFSTAQPLAFKPTAKLAPFTKGPIIGVDEDPVLAQANFDVMLLAAANTEFSAAESRLDSEWKSWRERHIAAQQHSFAQLKTSAEMRRFAIAYAQFDEAGLVESAQARAIELERIEQNAELERKAELEKERRALEVQERREAANVRRQEAEEAKRLATFRAGIQLGTETNCGPVVEVKKPLALVAAPVNGYGNTHWLRISQLFPPGFGCHFVNGEYQGR